MSLAKPQAPTPVPDRTPWAAWATAALCVASVAWQPFSLGFYMDDWPVLAAPGHMPPFSSAILSAVMSADSTRPTMTLIRYLGASILRGSPLLWQVALLASNLLVAWMLARFSSETGSGKRTPVPSPAALAVGATWLVLPWNAGCSFWPSLVPLNLSLALFAWAGTLLIRHCRRGPGWAFGPAALYLAALLSYEAFYFQLIPLLLITLILSRSGDFPRSRLLRPAAALALAQAIALTWYKLSSFTGQKKPVNTSWRTLLVTNIEFLPFHLLESFDNVQREILMALSISLALLIAAAVVKGKWKRLAAWCLPALAGACLSVVAFTLGGRELHGLGVETRANCLWSFWLVWLAGVAAAVTSRSARGAAWPLPIAGMVLCALFAWAHALRAQDWAEAWRRARAVLDSAPLAAIAAAPPDAAIIYLNDRDFNDAPILAAEWDIPFAMALAHGEVYRRNYVVYNHWMGPLEWDGARIHYRNFALTHARRVYIWEARAKRFYPVQAPVWVDESLNVRVPVTR